MIKAWRFASALLIFSGSGQCWASCSGSLVGANVPVSQVVSAARIVYIGEVSGLKLLTPSPMHNTRADYEVTFRAVTVLKGKPGRLQKGTFRTMYYESQPPSSGSADALRELVVNDDGRSFEFGKKYLLLVQSKGSLGAIGTCDNRVVGLSDLVIDQLQKVRQ
jgi:hypothetical protein